MLQRNGPNHLGFRVKQLRLPPEQPPPAVRGVVRADHQGAPLPPPQTGDGTQADPSQSGVTISLLVRQGVDAKNNRGNDVKVVGWKDVHGVEGPHGVELKVLVLTAYR